MTVTDTTMAQRIVELESEVNHLRAQLEGDMPKATGFLQWKVWRQRNALDILNHKVVTQRFVLRTLEELGRGLTREEYIKARDSQPEKLQARIEEVE